MKLVAPQVSRNAFWWLRDAELGSVLVVSPILYAVLCVEIDPL